MAGLGRRTFAPGEVLTATNVMGYLQDQTVMNFAGTAARGSAIGTAVVSEGMMTYLADLNVVDVYDGSAWKTIASTSGSVLQVVSETYSTSAVSSTTTYADTGLTATITPKFSTSKILVLVQQNGLYKSSGNTANSVMLRLLRGGTILNYFGYAIANTASLLQNFGSGAGVAFTDSPGVTTATTYKTQFANLANASEVGVQTGSATSTITLIEISA